MVRVSSGTQSDFCLHPPQLIVDHVERDKFSDSGVNENFYEALSKSGLTAIDPTNSLFKIKFLQLADTMGILEDSSNAHVLTKDDNHLIQMVDSCPRCLSSNTLNKVHMCREIPTQMVLLP